MKDKPILFSGPMVRAILDGRKTQTRRVIKPRPYNEAGDTVPIHIAKSAAYIRGYDGRWYFNFEHPKGGPLTAYVANWNVGDRLWVRETWAKVGDADDDIHACPDLRIPAYYRADSVCPEHLRWRPSIHMPRWASRLTLEVTGVKVERLQDISESDAQAEGVCHGLHDFDCQNGYFLDPAGYCVNGCGSRSYSEVFCRLWNSINGPGAWEANPWVAAITFTVHFMQRREWAEGAGYVIYDELAAQEFARALEDRRLAARKEIR